MTLTPNQREELRTLQQRFDDEAALKRAEAARAQWQPHRNPEPWWHRKWRKIVDWLDGGIE